MNMNMNREAHAPRVHNTLFAHLTYYILHVFHISRVFMRGGRGSRGSRGASSSSGLCSDIVVETHTYILALHNIRTTCGRGCVLWPWLWLWLWHVPRLRTRPGTRYGEGGEGGEGQELT